MFQERGLIEDQSIIDLEYRDGIVYGASFHLRRLRGHRAPGHRSWWCSAWSLEDEELLWQFAPILDVLMVEDLAFDDACTLWVVAGDQSSSSTWTSRRSTRRLMVPAPPSRWSPIDRRAALHRLGCCRLRLDVNLATGEQGEAAQGDARAPAADSLGQVWFSVGNAVHRFGDRARRRRGSRRHRR